MKKMLTLFLLVLLSPTIPRALADASPNKDVPANLWEPQAGILDVAFVLTTTVKSSKSRSEIRAYVKNTSSLTLALVASSTTDRGFNFYTIDGSGTKHLLHDHDPQHGHGTRLQEIAAYTGSVHLKQVAPGETIVRTIDVSPADLTLIKGFPLQAEFSIINPQTSQTYHIESSPRQLTETVIDASAPK